MEKEHKECKKCKTIFSYTPDETFWDESGMGYSTKLIRCSECGCINVINHVEDYGFDVNNNKRFYEYN